MSSDETNLGAPAKGEIDTLPMIKKQNERKDQVIKLLKRETPEASFTRSQKETRLKSLQEILEAFKITHEDILKYGKPDIPYIVNNLGDQTIKYIEEEIERMRNLKPLDAPPKSGGKSSTASQDSGSKTSSAPQLTEDEKRKNKLLLFKINKLNFTIEELYRELEEYPTWSRELFDNKTKFMNDQWAIISNLEEDIIMNGSVPIDEEICRSVLKNINAASKAMSDKISCQRSQSDSYMSSHQESKLPDLKVPIFKGDYIKWQNFKDIFESLIHNKTQLPTIQKMEYLKTYLDGEPLRLISAYTLSAENYDAAWEVLIKRYNNERKLLSIHLDNMRKPIGRPATSKSVKELHDSICEGMTSIKNMGIDTSSWGPIIVHYAWENLDPDTRTLFEEKFNDSPSKPPKLENFLRCLEARYKALENLDSSKSKSTSQSNGARAYVTDGELAQCQKCKGTHKLLMCPRFLALTVSSRYRFLKQIRGCFRCIQVHQKGECSDQIKPCKTCKSERHHSILHFDKKKPKIEVKSNQASASKQPHDSTEAMSALGMSNELDEVLGTCLVQVRDVFGNAFSIRVLIDSGAQRNYITESLVQRLRLPRDDCCTDVTGIANVTAFKVKHSVDIAIEPYFPSNFDNVVTALVMGKELTTKIPHRHIVEPLPEEWPELQLADPSFRVPRKVDMVLGVGVFSKILLPEILKSETSKLVALNSNFGWLICGETKTASEAQYRKVTSFVALSEVKDEISKFWELEEVDGDQKFMSKEDEVCEANFTTNLQRLDDGRYVVKIPFKEELKKSAELGTSRKLAYFRFLSLERKFVSNPSFAQEYSNFIKEYIRLGHMVAVNDDITDRDVFYMPHHAIIKPESTTTKLRVVFDASARTAINCSLNQVMMAGPRLQDDLTSILLRWRFHRYVLSADVEKMYRQIWINKEHRKYQRIYWRESPEEKLKSYELTTVTYGTTSAPYLAVKTLQQLAKDDREKYPIAAEVVHNDFYVDDLLTGADTVEDCKKLQCDVSNLLKGGGFELRKWTSNSEPVLHDVDVRHKSQGAVCFQQASESAVKTLGLRWIPQDNVFKFELHPIDFEQITPTKRLLCSDISKIFDPLGWLAPLTIVAKLLFQMTWKENLDWSDNLPTNLLNGWKQFRFGLSMINKIRIPRWLNTTAGGDIELHGFCDASQGAYAAAIYVRVTSTEGFVSCHLLMSKTKVAPVKQELTVAKLELSGALLAKLYQYVIRTFDWKDKPFVAWCDSTITLAWIRGEPSKWKIFVANRISQIQQLTDKLSWRYIATDQNPADCATRGLDAAQLMNHNLWWNGPQWLTDEHSTWPDLHIGTVPDLPELRKKEIVFTSTAISNKNDDIEEIVSRFSSYEQMRTTIALCLRFAYNCKNNKKKIGWLTTEELNYAEKAVLLQVQFVYYKEDIRRLQNKLVLNNANGILALSPLLDENGLLRVLGRLQNSWLSFDEKHPIILPRRSYLSRLIVWRAHNMCNHGMNTLTEYLVRRKFWIVQLKQLVKTLIFHCVKCRRRSPVLGIQQMGQLPTSRLDFNNAFYNSGVDYAGPFSLKPRKGRCNKVYKGYVCVFVCMATKAVHLELISDLTAEGFLAGYRRFSCRRGPCMHIFSDCGTNFVSANKMMCKDLKEYQKQWEQETKSLKLVGVTWHFNPPAAPHAGGIWETAVKQMKNMLYKNLGNVLLTYEEMTTLLVQIEGSLNSRPIGTIGSTPEDRMILTPNHFITGTSLFSQPEPAIEKTLDSS